MKKSKKMKKFEQVFDPVYLKGGEREKGAKKHGWHKHYKEMKVFKFTWKYCGTCRAMYVVCPKCGNNTCSAGFGEVKPDGTPKDNFADKGVTCDVCNLAYQFGDMAYKAKSVPTVSKKEMRRLEKRADDYMDELFS